MQSSFVLQGGLFDFCKLSGGAMGALPDGRYSDLSEWPGSVSDAAAPSARRAPGTPTGNQVVIGEIV